MNINDAAAKRIRENLHLSVNENVLALYDDLAKSSSAKTVESGTKRCVHNGHVLFIIDIPTNSIVSAQFVL